MSKFVYTPADQTDLRESFKRYKEMVRDENRRLHSGSSKQEASSPNPLGREVLGQQKQGLQRLRLVATGGQS